MQVLRTKAQARALNGGCTAVSETKGGQSRLPAPTDVAEGRGKGFAQIYGFGQGFVHFQLPARIGNTLQGLGVLLIIY